MKLKFYLDNGANIHSKREYKIDLEDHLGLTEEQWLSLDDGKKMQWVKEYVESDIEYWYEEE